MCSDTESVSGSRLVRKGFSCVKISKSRKTNYSTSKNSDHSNNNRREKYGTISEMFRFITKFFN